MDDDLDIGPIGFREFFTEFMKVSYYAKKVLFSLFLIILIFGIMLGYTEGIGVWEGIYLGFISAFTVGFGDVTPHTALGKILCAFVLPIFGMILTGIVVSIAIKSLERVIRENIENSKK